MAEQQTVDQAKDIAKQSLVPQIVRGAMEVAPTAGAAQVAAMVQARFVMAFQRPRNPDQVRIELLKECSRPSFALEEIEGEGNSALYRRPVGGGKIAEGLGIRFAEVAERAMGNIMSGALTISEDDKKKSKYCFVLDLETNSSWEDTIDISKVVERREVKPKDVVVSQRTNSTGQTVFTIAASEDALATKEAALISKKLRTLILRLVPGDLQDQCIAKIKQMRRDRITEDPDAAKNRIIDGMMLQNVNVTMLEEYLGHPVGQCSPAEILNLQGLYGALRDGMTTWAEVMADIEESRKIRPVAKPPEGQQPAASKGMDAAKAEPAAQPPTQAPVQPQPATQPAQPAQPPPTVADTPPVAQQTQPAPATPPPAQVVEQPVAPTPVPTPAPVVVPETQAAAPSAPPAWTAQQAVTETPAPVAPTPAPVAESQPAPAQTWADGWTQNNGVWNLQQPLKGGPGKIIKDVQFPAVLTRDSDAEAWDQAQFNRASAAMDKVNASLGKTFKLDKSIQTWFGTEMDKLTAQAMACVIQVLENWK